MTTPPDPSLFAAFQQFVLRHGADFTMRLLEAVDDKLDPAKPNLIFRSLAVLPLWSNLRGLSEMALENIVSCTERNLPFSYVVECDPQAERAGERVNVTCYPGDEWQMTVKRCKEARVRAPSTTVPAVGKKSSPPPLRNGGQRH